MSRALCSSEDCPFVCGREVDVQCEAYTKATAALHTYFKYSNFRPGQLDALLPVLHGRDTFVCMATGAGKSMCIFLPPLAVGPDALGVVISPLNGLMDQQVQILVV